MNRRLAMIVISVVLSLAVPVTVLAAAPTPSNGTRSWAKNAVTTYRFDSSVVAWMKPYIQDVLDVQWESATTNNSAHVDFSYSAAGAGTIKVADSTGLAACDTVTYWLGCADGSNHSAWKIWLRKTPSHPWCQVSNVTGCYDLERVLIHEVGHIGGYLGHNVADTNYLDTVMTVAPPKKGVSGYNIHHLQRCDEATMQLLYDVKSISGPYADCFADIAGSGTTGLLPTLTSNGDGLGDCYGVMVPVSGRLAIKSTTSYQELSGNALAGRVVSFDRRVAGTTTWTTDVATTTTTTGATGNNWTEGFSGSGTGPSVTYEFRAHFAGEAGVDAGYSPIFTMRWGRAC
jgi:hypothetical protein